MHALHLWHIRRMRPEVELEHASRELRPPRHPSSAKNKTEKKRSKGKRRKLRCRPRSCTACRSIVKWQADWCAHTTNCSAHACSQTIRAQARPAASLGAEPETPFATPLDLGLEPPTPVDPGAAQATAPKSIARAVNLEVALDSACTARSMDTRCLTVFRAGLFGPILGQRAVEQRPPKPVPAGQRESTDRLKGAQLSTVCTIPPSASAHPLTAHPHSQLWRGPGRCVRTRDPSLACRRKPASQRRTIKPLLPKLAASTPTMGWTTKPSKG